MRLHSLAILVPAIAYDLGPTLTNSNSWPDWDPNTEFKSLRDQTDSERPK
jgi:hypothetical protein